VDSIALALARLVEIYLATGLVFAIAFVRYGIGEIDPDARTGTRGFRVSILPGAAALWPLLLRRWLAARAAQGSKPIPPRDDA
jgi:hypothetical protein